MKFVVICDNPEKWQQCSIITSDVGGVEQILVPTVGSNEKKYLYDVAAEIKKETLNSDSCIIVVEQFLTCADEGFEWLQRNAGIALIKFLRMLDVRQHIVLITPFEPIDLIRQDHGNLIVTSKGISFSKHHYDFSEKTKDEVETLGTEIFDEEQELDPYILADFHLPENERHNWANWWGVLRLIDVHKHLFANELEHWADQYPLMLLGKLKLLKSREAMFLYSHGVDLSGTLSDIALRDLENARTNKAHSIEELQVRIEGTGKKNPKPNDLFDYVKDLEERIKKYGNEEYFDTKVFEERLDKARNSLQLGKKSLEIIKNELNEINTKVLFSSSDDAHGFREEIEKYRSSQNKGDYPRILYVDDNADIGWSDIIQVIIYGKKSPEKFKSLSGTHQSINALCNEVIVDIKDNSRDLVFLDLRLKNETGNFTEVRQLSGAEVLIKIREEFPGIPVMMTTASNKHWSYQSLLSIGANAYWMKEGLDVTSSNNVDERNSFTIENYRKFIRSVHQLCGAEYTLLRELGGLVKRLESEAFWWEQGQWQYPKIDSWDDEEKRFYKRKLKNAIQNPAKEPILEIMKEVINFYSIYLKYVFSDDEFHKEINWFYPSLIVQQLGKVIEYIHGFDGLTRIFRRNKKNDPNSMVLDYRKDTEGKDLYKKRNEVSHIAAVDKVDIDFLKEFLTAFIDYLGKSPDSWECK